MATTELTYQIEVAGKRSWPYADVVTMDTGMVVMEAEPG